MTEPSLHFTWQELGAPPERYHSNTRHLAAHLERARELIGAPLPVLSGFRTARRNRQVGGATASLHLVGLAADLPVGALTTEDALRAGFRGVGSTGRWATHVDMRTTAPAHWHY